MCVFSYESMKLSKLRRHLESKHKEHACKPVNTMLGEKAAKELNIQVLYINNRCVKILSGSIHYKQLLIFRMMSFGLHNCF